MLFIMGKVTLKRHLLNRHEGVKREMCKAEETEGLKLSGCRDGIRSTWLVEMQ